MEINGLSVRKPAEQQEFNTFLIDGVAGVGKSSLLATVGSGKKILVIDFEGGTVSYSAPNFASLPDATEVENIDIISLPAHGDGAVTNAAQLVHAVEGVFDHLIRTKNSDGYALVAVDSLTEFQRRFIDLHVANDPRQSYGAWAEAIYAIVHKARATAEIGRLNVVFTSRPRVSKDEVSGTDIVRSDVSPAAWSVISGLFDAAGLYAVTTNLAGKSTRSLDFTHDQRYLAKQRLGLATKLDNPTMKSLLDLIASKRDSVPQKAAPVVSKPTTVPKFGGKINGTVK